MEDNGILTIKKLLRPPNTDNKGHLFVTVFEHPAFYFMTRISLYPDSAPVYAQRLYNMTNSWLRCRFVPRHCTSTHLLRSCMVTQYYSLSSFVPRHAYRQESLYHDSKNRAIPSLRRDSILAKVPGPCPALTSGNTNALYCRAVSIQARFAHMGDNLHIA
jgi:hypothetical protein